MADCLIQLASGRGSFSNKQLDSATFSHGEKLGTGIAMTSVFIEEGLEVQKLSHKMFFYLLSSLLGLPAIRCLQAGYTAGGGAGLHT